MRSKLHGCSQPQGTPVVHRPVAGWTVHPAGYELDTPKTCEVKLSVSARPDDDGLALGERLGESEAEGDAAGEADGDGVAAAPDPVAAGRKGPTARATTPTAITAAAAVAVFANVFMCWNLRGRRMS